MKQILKIQNFEAQKIRMTLIHSQLFVDWPFYNESTIKINLAQQPRANKEIHFVTQNYIQKKGENYVLTSKQATSIR